MRHLILLASACLAAGCATDDPVETAAADEASLTAQLRGFEPDGPPVRCVSMRDLQGNESAGNSAIVFSGSGGRKWVNRPAAGCPDLGFSRALKTRTPSTRLCRGDIATVFDPVSGFAYGGCGLGEFEPSAVRGEDASPCPAMGRSEGSARLEERAGLKSANPQPPNRAPSTALRMAPSRRIRREVKSFRTPVQRAPRGRLG